MTQLDGSERADADRIEPDPGVDRAPEEVDGRSDRLRRTVHLETRRRDDVVRARADDAHELRAAGFYAAVHPVFPSHRSWPAVPGSRATVAPSRAWSRPCR